MGDLSDKEKENALNEIRILASIRYVSCFYLKELQLFNRNEVIIWSLNLFSCLKFSHPNIIQYMESFIDEPS